MLAGGDALKLDTIVTNKQQLAAWLESGCRPRAQWGMGTEHEKFGFCLDTLKPLPYDGERSIRAILEGLARQYGWRRVQEEGLTTGLEKDDCSVSLEPGGQLERSEERRVGRERR